MKRVLVTGGTGFLASHLIPALLTEGHHVAFTTRCLDKLRHPRADAYWDHCVVFEADVRNRGALAKCKEWEPDVVIHNAAYHHVGYSFLQVEECFDVNAKGTANVLDTFPDSYRLYISTSEVYGAQTDVPWHEDLRPQPLSPYGVSKYAGELYAWVKQQQGQNIGIVRPFNIFGPGQSPRAVIGKIARDCLAGTPIHTNPGLQTRQFTYVTNVVEVLVQLVARQWPGGPMNVAAGEEIAIKDLIERIHGLTHSTSPLCWDQPYRPNEIWRMKADTTILHKTLDWTPTVSFSEGLVKTLDWYAQ